MSNGDAAGLASSRSGTVRISNVFGWGLMVGLGLLVWELTDRTGWAAAVACLKFGWDDAATGLWLLTRDPWRRRGWACATFHWASACGRFGLISVVVAIVVEQAVIFVRQLRGLPPVPVRLDDSMVTLMLLAICGLGAWCLPAGVVLVVALTGRVRVWLDPTTHWSRRAGVWPPQPWGRNRARIAAVLYTVGFSHLFGLAALAVVWGTWMLLVTIPATAILGWFAAKRIVAHEPDDCWRNFDLAESASRDG